MIASVEKGRTTAKAWCRPTKQEVALQRWSTEVAFVHKNEFGELDVDCGDRAVCAVEASAQVHELAHVSTGGRRVGFTAKVAESFGFQVVDRHLQLVNASTGRSKRSVKGS